MAFRYENYGNANLLLTSATTLTNLPTSQSICGYAFWGSQTQPKNINVPAGIKEIWIKLDLFCAGNMAKGDRFSFGHYSSSLGGYVGIWNGANDSGTTAFYRFLIDAKPTTARNTKINATRGSINSVLLHMVSASSGGIIELNVNGSTYKYTGNVNNGDDFDYIYFYSNNSNTLFSNIIVSDSEIALSDNVSACLFNVNFDAQRIIKHSVTIPTNRYSISFADSDCATLPLDVLPNASVFTIEAKFSTTSIKSSDYNWRWGTIAGVEIGGNWKNDFGLCVNNGYLCFWAEPSTGGSSATNNTVSNAIVNDGLIHNVAVVSNADGSIDLFCDGVKVAHTDNVNAKISDSYNIRVAYDNDSNSYLPMDLYELRFWSTARNDIWADISGSEDNLEAWLLPTDNALLDFSGFDRHATISGNPTFNLLSSSIHFDVSFDAQRLVGNTVTIDFDAERIISPPAVHFDTTFDAERIISPPAVHFDTTFDAQRLVHRSVILDADAQRLVHRSVILDADAQRIVKKSLTIDFDSCRNVHRTVNFLVDTCRNISHKFIMTPAKDGILYATAEESTGIQSLQIDIAPQQVTDQFSFATVNNVDILQNVKGQYLDYVFDLRIEKTTSKGILNTCLCCSDVDKILYTQLAYKVKSTSGGLFVVGKDGNTTMQEKPKASAHTHIKKIADILGKNLVYLADEFTSTVDTDPEGVTYNDLIRDIFGWSSRVPTKLINCYIRNDTLCVIQRGHEQNIIDISNAKITLPTITKELFRTTWGSTPTSQTIIQKQHNIGDWEPILGNPLPDDYPSSGGDDDDNSIEPADTSRVLPRRVENPDSVIEYQYDDDGNVTKTTTTTEDGKTVVENFYEVIFGRKYLAKEITTEYDLVGGQWIFIDSSTVYHDYLTQGQQNITAIDSDGKIKGSLTSSSKVDDRPTPFEHKRYAKSVDGHIFTSTANPDWATYTYVDGVKYEVLGYRKVNSYDDKELTINGIALYDSSFPIDDVATLRALTAELQRLNRTTQETITLDIFDYPHIFDFNDRIIFGGNEYFVDSNSVSKTPRIVNKQSLKLVRWI